MLLVFNSPWQTGISVCSDDGMFAYAFTSGGPPVLVDAGAGAEFLNNPMFTVSGG